MAIKRCENGHIYDDEKHTFCPYCPAFEEEKSGGTYKKIGDTIEKTRLVSPSYTNPYIEDEKVDTIKPVYKSAYEKREDGEMTLYNKPESVKNDPVVGWLVCVEGDEIGRDFRIHSERNYIGRSKNMDICIENDKFISRENHAVISYSPVAGTFKIIAGEGRGIVYLNGNEVDNSEVLKPYDIITMGESKFSFVPFVGEKYNWGNRENDKRAD